MNINSGKPWSEKDLFDLRDGLEHGEAIEELAEFLCRDVGEVITKAQDLGYSPRPSEKRAAPESAP